jgi:uncharacterized cupin superfamily protein
MATILKASRREFRESLGKTDPFRIFTDVSVQRADVRPQNLNFDLRQLNPDEYSGLYHFHRHAEELFMIVSGTATLRTPAGLEIVEAGDLLFFEMGETGAHQLYNHTAGPCVYLDVRTFIGVDVCEYPDSGKLFIAPTREIFRKDDAAGYFDGEENVREKWQSFERKGKYDEK